MSNRVETLLSGTKEAMQAMPKNVIPEAYALGVLQYLVEELSRISFTQEQQQQVQSILETYQRYRDRQETV